MNFVSIFFSFFFRFLPPKKSLKYLWTGSIAL